MDRKLETFSPTNFPVSTWPQGSYSIRKGKQLARVLFGKGSNTAAEAHAKVQAIIATRTDVDSLSVIMLEMTEQGFEKAMSRDLLEKEPNVSLSLLFHGTLSTLVEEDDPSATEVTPEGKLEVYYCEKTDGAFVRLYPHSMDTLDDANALYEIAAMIGVACGHYSCNLKRSWVIAPNGDVLTIEDVKYKN